MKEIKSKQRSRWGSRKKKRWGERKCPSVKILNICFEVTQNLIIFILDTLAIPLQPLIQIYNIPLFMHPVWSEHNFIVSQQKPQCQRCKHIKPNSKSIVILIESFNIMENVRVGWVWEQIRSRFRIWMSTHKNSHFILYVKHMPN